MIVERIPIQVENSHKDTHATTYILDTPDGFKVKKRPLVIVCPGGAYEFTSEREGEPIAIAYNNMGYHSIVLDYSVAPAKYPTALLELAFLVKYVHLHANEWKVDEDQIFIQGFSAGGHLVANYGVSWNDDFIKESIGATKEELQAAGILLAYPVISSGIYAHKGSFENLVGLPQGFLTPDNGNAVGNERELLEFLSLEKRVNKDVPPCFIWTTFEDTLVPPENSIMFMTELRKMGIYVEFHMFAKGWHGLSLGKKITMDAVDEYVEESVSPWIDLVHTFIEKIIEL